MKRTFVTLAFSMAALGATGPGWSWLRPPPADLVGSVSGKEVNKSLYAQVPEARMNEAESLLAAATLIPLKAEQARRFSDGAFACKGESSPYLVRAVYEHARDAEAFVLYEYKDKGAILVSHYSLGQPGVAYRTAFVVCSTTSLRNAYNYLGGAM